ncbi:MAG TPA: hypothetical protein VFF28_00500 [Candidatus Nanoarchaeia archaeon]|nr:hypothetical protein [Candidatus Nanoarchaeia archaeon]
MANYYIKANRQEWKYNNQHTDWDNFPLNHKQDFATFTKNQLYWKGLKKGDIIIGHSSYLSSNIKGKIKFTPLPRISAIAIVTNEEHYSKKLDSDSVTLKKVIEFSPIKISIDIINKNKLYNAEPFRLGTNRCTITKLSDEEFEKVIKLIEQYHPNIKRELKSI